MTKVFDYAIGYLRRPTLWWDLFRQPWRLVRLHHPREATREEARTWAASRAISTAEAIGYLGRVDDDTEMLTIRHAETLAQATKLVNDLPVRLGGSGNIDLLYSLVRLRMPSAVVETGVAAGWSTLAILLAMDDNQKGHLISIDRPDMKLIDDNCIGTVVPERLRHKWTLLLGVDKDKLPFALKSAGSDCDIAHYDSDKSYLGRAWAYKVIMGKLPVGGILVSDDIADNTAFKDFCESMDIEPIIVSYGESGFCGIAVKPPAASSNCNY